MMDDLSDLEIAACNEAKGLTRENISMLRQANGQNSLGSSIMSQESVAESDAEKSDEPSMFPLNFRNAANLDEHAPGDYKLTVNLPKPQSKLRPAEKYKVPGAQGNRSGLNQSYHGLSKSQSDYLHIGGEIQEERRDEGSSPHQVMVNSEPQTLGQSATLVSASTLHLQSRQSHSIVLQDVERL